MVYEEDRWPGVVGPFIVSSDGLPVSHTAVRQDDPDLAVMRQVLAARDKLRKARLATESIGIKLSAATDREHLNDCIVRAMRDLLHHADELDSLLYNEQCAHAEWAKVLQRIGFKDAFGIDHPLPDKLARLLPEEPGEDG